jgi:hypothetical protein
MILNTTQYLIRILLCFSSFLNAQRNTKYSTGVLRQKSSMAKEIFWNFPMEAQKDEVECYVQLDEIMALTGEKQQG